MEERAEMGFIVNCWSWQKSEEQAEMGFIVNCWSRQKSEERAEMGFIVNCWSWQKSMSLSANMENIWVKNSKLKYIKCFFGENDSFHQFYETPTFL